MAKEAQLSKTKKQLLYSINAIQKIVENLNGAK